MAASGNLRRLSLCLVTDRRRLAAETGQFDADGLVALHAQVAGAIRGGIDLVQIREPDLGTAVLLELTESLVALARPAGVRVVVNDRLDVAIAAGADGVHLRGGGVPIGRVRAAVPEAGFLVGRSVHDEEGACRSAAADYLIVGHIFDSVSKPGRGPLGVDGLARIVRAAGSTPVLAIGGVTADAIGRLVEAGAVGVAAIGAFIPPRSADDVAAAVQKMTHDLRIRFDSHRYVP